MQILRTDDPRSPLDKARRQEHVKFANDHGLEDVTEAMPAMVIRKILREKGLVNIKVPDRQLGSFVQPESVTEQATEQNVNTVDAEADLARQFAEQAKPDYAAMSINELRAECRKNGIKIERRDNLNSLRAKLNG
jgi:hypothetical protein